MKRFLLFLMALVLSGSIFAASSMAVTDFSVNSPQEKTTTPVVSEESNWDSFWCFILLIIVLFVGYFFIRNMKVSKRKSKKKSRKKVSKRSKKK